MASVTICSDFGSQNSTVCHCYNPLIIHSTGHAGDFGDSVYSIENEEYYLDTNFSTSEEFNLFLNKIKERSVYDFNVDLDSTEEIITLSTCGITSKTRVVLHAKK